MPEQTEAKETRKIKPLTIDQVDWLLFCQDRQTQERLRNLKKEGPLRFFDFHDYGVSLLEKVQGVKGGVEKLGGHPEFGMTEEVKELLRQNRLPRIFYEPEDIPSLLQGQDELVVKHFKLGVVLYWSIQFNRDYADTIAKQMARLDVTRLDQNVFQQFLQRKPQGATDRIFCPYLEVFYAADYKDGLLIFRPFFESSFPTSQKPQIIGAKLAPHLGLSDKRIPAKLNFEATDPQSFKISVSMS